MSPRSEAKSRGERYYLSATPCPRGNLAGRRVSDGNCVCAECMTHRRAQHADNLKAWIARNPDKVRAIKQASAKRTKPRKAIYAAQYRRANAARILAATRKRQADKLRATPPWADLEKIAAMYGLAREFARRYGGEWHVDHCIPLRGKTVSGLHVENNLRICPASENLSKGNGFDQDEYNSLLPPLHLQALSRQD